MMGRNRLPAIDLSVIPIEACCIGALRNAAIYGLTLLATQAELEYCLIDLKAARDDRALQSGISADYQYLGDLGRCLLSIGRRRLIDLLTLRFIKVGRILPGALGALFALLAIWGTLLDASDTSWWGRSGFSYDPGFYLGANPVDYTICASWGGDDQPPAPSARTHVTIIRGRLDGGALTTLLPTGTHVHKLYCALTRGNEPLSTCTHDHCEDLTFWVDDSKYTMGHVVTLGLLDQDAVKAFAAGEVLWGQVWVEWRDAGDDPEDVPDPNYSMNDAIWFPR